MLDETGAARDFAADSRFPPANGNTIAGLRDTNPGEARCVAKTLQVCEPFVSTATRYNRDGDTSNPESLDDPADVCHALGSECVYKQASFPDRHSYHPIEATEAECLSDPDHDTNLFGHLVCSFNFYWRNVFAECYDGELFGFRPACFQCTVQPPEVPSCKRHVDDSVAPMCHHVRSVSAGGDSVECISTAGCSSVITEEQCDGGLDVDCGALDRCEFPFVWVTAIDRSEADARTAAVDPQPVAVDWLTWAASWSVSRQSECEAVDIDGDGEGDGLWQIDGMCTALAPAIGHGPWYQPDTNQGLVVPGFDPSEIDGVVIIANEHACGQAANAGARTLKINGQTYRFDGLAMSFHPPDPTHGGSCSESNDPWCGGDKVFCHELIHQLGVGFHSYGPGEYDDGECTNDFRDCPFARYGNIMSILGSASAGTELDAHLRYFMYWLDKEQVTVIRQDGQYTINPLADPSAVKRAAQIVVTGTAPEGHSHPGEWGEYWLEYRPAIGFDTTLAQSQFVSNTQGLIIAAGSTVIDARTTLTAGPCRSPVDRSPVDDCYEVAMGDCASSYDMVGTTYRKCLGTDGQCDGDDSAEDCPPPPAPPAGGSELPDWTGISINSEWSDPYSDLVITIDSFAADEIVFTVAGIPTPESPTPEPATPPAVEPAPSTSVGTISLSLTLAVQYSDTWRYRFFNLGYTAQSRAEADEAYAMTCVDNMATDIFTDTDEPDRFLPTGGEYTTEFFAKEVEAGVSAVLGITPSRACVPSDPHVGLSPTCHAGSRRVIVTNIMSGGNNGNVLVAFDIVPDPLTGEPVDADVATAALTAEGVTIIVDTEIVGGEVGPPPPPPAEPIPEPASTPEPAPTSEPVPEPAPEPVPEPVLEPDAPTPEPSTPEPSPEPSHELSHESVPEPEPESEPAQLCSASSFSSNLGCDSGSDASASAFNRSGVCDGTECVQSECCGAPQLCSASSFGSDVQCAAVSGSALSLFHSSGICVGMSCMHAECCVAPQLCSVSTFSNDSACAAGPEPALSLFDSGGRCAALACLQSECCEAPAVHCDGNYSDWYHSDNHTHHGDLVADMESGAFTDWLDCSATCGGGVQWRHFVVRVESSNGGTTCAAAHGHSEQQSCNEHPCSADAVCSWSDWGTCSAECGNGTRSRAHLLSHPAAGGGQECTPSANATESESCNTHSCSAAVDCAGEWGGWAECACGNGTSIRHYHVVTHAANGGSSDTCDTADMTEAVEACSGGPCPVDCSGHWGTFGECSLSCGGGWMTRTYSVDVRAAHGGSQLPCENPNGGTDSAPCNEEPCPEPEPEPEPEPVPVVVPAAAEVVPVETTVYTPVQLEAAKVEVFAAVAAAIAAAAAAPDESDAAAVVTIASAITFPVGIEVIAEGSAARDAFEADFKTQMAGKLGGGGVFDADDVVIDSIVAGSVEVAFHVDAPAAVKTEVASMVTTMAASGDTIAITVGDTEMHASTAAMSPPVVHAPAPAAAPSDDAAAVGGGVEIAAPTQASGATMAVRAPGVVAFAVLAAVM